jgi:hypothetical protein
MRICSVCGEPVDICRGRLGAKIDARLGEKPPPAYPKRDYMRSLAALARGGV